MSSLLSLYTTAPQYPNGFKTMLTLKEEIETCDKTQLTKWIASSMRFSSGARVLSLLKKGIFASDLEADQLDQLLSSLQEIKSEATNPKTTKSVTNGTGSGTVSNSKLNKLNDIEMDIRIPSPPPFEFENSADITPRPGSVGVSNATKLIKTPPCPLTNGDKSSKSTVSFDMNGVTEMSKMEEIDSESLIATKFNVDIDPKPPEPTEPLHMVCNGEMMELIAPNGTKSVDPMDVIHRHQKEDDFKNPLEMDKTTEIPPEIPESTETADVTESVESAEASVLGPPPVPDLVPLNPSNSSNPMNPTKGMKAPNSSNPLNTTILSKMPSPSVTPLFHPKCPLFLLSNQLLSIICSYHDLDSLLQFERCCKRTCAVAREPDSFHNESLTIKYSLELHDSLDLLDKAFPRFTKCKVVHIDHYDAQNGNDATLWQCVVEEVFTHFTNLQTISFGIDWIGISYVAEAVAAQIGAYKTSKMAFKNEDLRNHQNAKTSVTAHAVTLKNLTVKHALQKAVTKKSRGRGRSKKKKSSSPVPPSRDKVVWERTKREEITEMTIPQTVDLSQLILAFDALNSITFDMVQFPPTFEVFNALRSVPIECIAFNDCVELGFFDHDRFIVPSILNRRPLCCQSMIIRDVDHDTFDEFFDPECCPYFWPLQSLRNLMIHWNITKRDYDRFINGNIAKLKEHRERMQRRTVSKHSKRSSKMKKPPKRMSMDPEYPYPVEREKKMSFLPDLSRVETLYISIINVNGFKSLILFLSATKLVLNLKSLVLRIPKNMNTTKIQLALNSDLSKMLSLLNRDTFKSLRIEVVESPWILVWNVVNVIAKHCGVVHGDNARNQWKGAPLILQSLEVHVYDPTSKGGVSRGKKEREQKEMILKIKDCLVEIGQIGYLGLFVNASRHFDERIVDEFATSGFERKSSDLWFVKKRRALEDEGIVSHLEQYWEPHGIDPYA